MTRFALAPRRTVAPAQPPVSLAEAKAHLRIDHDLDDALVTALVAAATGHLDGWSGVLGRCLVTQTWAAGCAGFPAGNVLRFPLPGLQSVAVSYFDAINAAQVLDAARYTLIEDALGAALVLADGESWPATASRPDAVTLTAVAGYGPPAAVPAPLKAAILLMTGDLYRYTESVAMGQIGEVKMSLTVHNLITPYRRVGL